MFVAPVNAHATVVFRDHAIALGPDHDCSGFFSAPRLHRLFCNIFLNNRATINFRTSQGLYHTSRTSRRTACTFSDACPAAVAVWAINLSLSPQIGAF
jgi:hypothetical protein